MLRLEFLFILITGDHNDPGLVLINMNRELKAGTFDLPHLV